MITTFKIKQNIFLTEVLVSTMAIIIATYIPISYEVSHFLSTKLMSDKIIASIFSILFIFSIFFYRIFIVFNYYNNDKNKRITIDTDKEILELVNETNHEFIKFSDIYLINEYHSTGLRIQSYYKLSLKNTLLNGENTIFITYLTAPYIETYLKDIEFKSKSCFNLLIPKIKNNTQFNN